MELVFFLVFLTVLALASLAGKTFDSHDSADWKPSRGGFREPQTY